MLEIKKFTFNVIGTNCYVLSDDSRECVVIDDGALFPDEEKMLCQYIDAHQFVPVFQLLTHAHFDHIFGTGSLYHKYGVKACFHAEDAPLYYDVSAQLQQIMGRDFPVEVAPLANYVQEGDEIKFGTHSLKVLFTPGHSPGGVCYYCEAEKILFCGDTLFQRSIGRTDFQGGSFDTLIASIRNQIFTLPDDVVIYPGHGPETSVGEEKRENPYVN